MATYKQSDFDMINVEQTGFTREWGLTYSPDQILSHVKDIMPKYARLTNANLILEWKTSLSTQADYKLYINNSRIGDTYHAKKNWVHNEHSGIQGYFCSESERPHIPIGNIRVNLSSTILRTFSIRLLKIVFDYQVPVFVVSLSAGTGGTVSGAGTYDVGANATITATPASGYKFVKWSDGNTNAKRTVTVADGSQTAFSTSLSYTAIFEKEKVPCTITYDGNGANIGSLEEQSGYVEEAITLPECKIDTETGTIIGFVKYGLVFFMLNRNESYNTPYQNSGIATFLGWYTAAEGGTKVGDGGESYTPRGSITLYAHWSEMPTITLPTPTKDRYVFLGWYTEPEGGTKVGDGEASYRLKPESESFYAHWKLNEITDIYIGTSILDVYMGTSKLDVYQGTTKIYG